MFNLNWLFLRDLLKSYISLPVCFCCCCSVAKSCPDLCNPMNRSTAGFPVLHHLLEHAWSHVQWLVMPSNHLHLCHPLPLPSVFLNIRVFSSELALLIRCQSIGVSSSASVLPMNIQGWLSLGLTGLIFLLFKGLSRVFSSITVGTLKFFNVQSSLWPNSHICTWLLKKPHFDYIDNCWPSDISAL